MIAGFKSNIYTKGIIGDGCGGDRYFIVEDETLFAYDEISKQSIKLLDNIKNPISIRKNRCIITIECKNKTINFDLSSIKSS